MICGLDHFGNVSTKPSYIISDPNHELTINLQFCMIK